MTKKTIKELMFILVILVLALYSISGTYARYTGEATGKGRIDVAKWHIEVAGAHNEQTMTIKFTQVENEHVVDGKMAPATQMYADIEIDPTDTEVSIDYWFTLGAIKSTEDAAVPQDLSVTKVCLLDGESDGKELSKVGEAEGTKYMGSILLKDGAQAAFTEADKVKVRIYAEWKNNEAHNTNDSEIARKTIDEDAPTYEIEVVAHCQQHIKNV